MPEGFLYAALKIRKNEVKRTAWHFFYLLNVVSVIIIGRSAASSLFLAHFEADALPWMYVASAVGVSASSWIYSRLTSRVRLDRLITGTTILLVLLTFAARGAALSSSLWVFPALYVLVEMMGSLLIIQFWSLANTVHTTREAKRLFGVIGAGGVLANIIVGFGAAAIVLELGTENLLFVMVFSLLACLLSVNRLGRIGRQQLLAAQAKGAGSRKRAGISIGQETARIFASKHLRIIAMVVMLTFVVTTLVDFQFKVLAKATYDSADLTAFFALLYGFTGILSLGIQLFITGRLLERFGIIASLSLLPLTLGIGSALVFLMPTALMAALAKGGDAVFRYTVNDATTQLLYLPVPAQNRLKAKAFIDGILKPVSYGGTGLALALVVMVLPGLKDHVQWLALPAALLACIWMVLVLGIREEYVRMLLDSLRRRRLDLGTSPLRISDDATIHALVKSLDSEEAQQVCNALELIKHVENYDWDPHVVGLLNHMDARVRRGGLAHLSLRGSLNFGNEVFRCFEDPDESVRATAITSYCAIGREKAIRAVRNYLNDESPEIRAAAIIGMIKFGGLDGVLAAAEALKGLLENDAPRLREHGAKVLGSIHVQNFYQPVLRLLGDPDPKVRLAAVEAAGLMQSPELVLPLIYKLGDKNTAPAAIAALASFGTKIERTLAKVMCNQQELISIRRNIPPVLGRLATEGAAEILAASLIEVDGLLRTRICRALNRIHTRRPGLHLPRPEVGQAIEAEARTLFERQRIIADLNLQEEPLERGGLLRAALEESAEAAINRIFLLLGVLYPSKTIDVVHAGIHSEVKTIRANAVEVLDNTLSRALRRVVLPAVDETPVGEKLNVGEQLFQLGPVPFSVALQGILKDESSWVRACGLRYIALLPEIKDQEISETLVPCLGSRDAVVRETAAWAVKQRLPNSAQLLETLASDPNPRVRQYASAG